ncbi:MAG: YwaF family protein [Oscillospiraceae bacterium]|nr:YwaF family protein [Oscillospiraceae bacterium]
MRNHYIWLGISFCVIVIGIRFLMKKRIPLRTVLSVCCILAVVSEYIKVFSSVEMLPLLGVAGNYPFLDIGHMPFHLCSIQIIFIFYVRFARPSRFRDAMLAFMYPTCAAGAFFALLMPNIFPSSIDISQAFTHPLAYQYFLWHCALIVMGVYIPLSGEVQLSLRRWVTSSVLISVMGFVSIYVNAACASVVYEAGKPASLNFATNFMFTMQTPIGIPLTEKWQWMLYYLTLQLLAILSILLLYLPFLQNRRKA